MSPDVIKNMADRIKNLEALAIDIIRLRSALYLHKDSVQDIETNLNNYEAMYTEQRNSLSAYAEQYNLPVPAVVDIAECGATPVDSDWYESNEEWDESWEGSY